MRVIAFHLSYERKWNFIQKKEDPSSNYSIHGQCNQIRGQRSRTAADIPYRALVSPHLHAAADDAAGPGSSRLDNADRQGKLRLIAPSSAPRIACKQWRQEVSSQLVFSFSFFNFIFYTLQTKRKVEGEVPVISRLDLVVLTHHAIERRQSAPRLSVLVPRLAI